MANRFVDSIATLHAVKSNGWSMRDAVKASGMVFSSGGFAGLMNNNWWPQTFRKLSDPWPLRVWWDSRYYDIEGIYRNAVAGSCIGWILRNFPEANCMAFQGEGDDAEKLKDHPFTRLLSNPNPFYTREELLQCVVQDWWIGGRGNAYLKKERNRAGEPIKLWHIPAHEMTPHWPKDKKVVGERGYIDYYERSIDGTLGREEVDDIIHFRFGRDPKDQRIGWSPLAAGMLEVGTMNEGTSYRRAVLSNHGVPSYALVPKDENVARQLSTDKTELIQKVFQSKFTGLNRAANLFIPNFAANMERMGFSPEELDIRGMMSWDADVVCSLFGLNSMILGLPSGEGHRTYSNQEDARKGAYRENVIPTHMLMAPILERDLLREMDKDPDIHVGWDYSKVGVLQPDAHILWDRLDKSVERGWCSPNEARKRAGLPPIDDAMLEKFEKGGNIFDIPQVITRLGPVPWRNPAEFPSPGEEREVTGPEENSVRRAFANKPRNGNGNKPRVYGNGGGDTGGGSGAGL